VVKAARTKGHDGVPSFHTSAILSPPHSLPPPRCLCPHVPGSLSFSAGDRVNRPRGTGSVGDSVGEGKRFGAALAVADTTLPFILQSVLT